MKPRRRRSTAVLTLCALWWMGHVAVGVAAGEPPTVTLLVASDSHFGAPGMDPLNESVAEQMNNLPGTDYPSPIGGKVQTPRGLLFLGDMTDSSNPEDWQRFEQIYGLTGWPGRLKYPVFETIGNHDIIGDSPIKDHVIRRHGSLVYSWNWAGILFACLDLHPDDQNLSWLAKTLKKHGRRQPVIIFFHYSIEGPYSAAWEPQQKEALAKTIEHYNVIAIFHGHYHRSGRYVWHGHDVFLPGSPRHSSHAFLVVRIDANSLAVGFWDFDLRSWKDGFVKSIRR